MVPALFFAFAAIGVDPDVIMHCAVATSVSVIIVNGYRSTRSHLARNSVDIKPLWPRQWWRGYALWIGVGSFVGAWWLAPRLSSDMLTLIFASVRDQEPRNCASDSREVKARRRYEIGAELCHPASREIRV